MRPLSAVLESGKHHRSGPSDDDLVESSSYDALNCFFAKSLRICTFGKVGKLNSWERCPHIGKTLSINGKLFQTLEHRTTCILE